MALTFDHSTKLISVPQADAQPIMLQTIIDAIRTEEASERGITYDQIADASGKESLGGSVSTAITVSLRSTWKLNFASGSYQATISGGNLSDVLNKVNNTGSPQVVALSSAAATLVTSTGGTIADDVWAHAQATDLVDKTTEIHKIHGLDSVEDLVVTPTTRTVGSGISQTITDVGGTVTVSRN